MHPCKNLQANKVCQHILIFLFEVSGNVKVRSRLGKYSEDVMGIYYIVDTVKVIPTKLTTLNCCSQ
jgi:hypothetical protein